MLAALAVASCGGSPTTPTPPPAPTPAIAAVTPSTGPSLGGTVVSVTGTHLSGATSVTFGGTPATDLAVKSDNEISVKTPAHAIGQVDVAVTAGANTGVAHNAFAYALPSKNTPPAISAITAQGNQPNEPSGFADLGEEITVTAQVQDAETPVDQLTYNWTADTGTISGSGRTVKWRAPASATTPLTIAIGLTVVEQYTGTDPTGLPVPMENRVSGGVTVSLHNSIKEIGDISYQFLLDFSHSDVSAATAVRNFTDSCPGKAEEQSEIEANRVKYKITAWDLGQPFVTINFEGVCTPTWRARKGDACSSMSAHWVSTVISDPDPTRIGTVESVYGTDHMTAMFQNNRWWLCDSDYQGQAPLHFIK